MYNKKKCFRKSVFKLSKNLKNTYCNRLKGLSLFRLSDKYIFLHINLGPLK